jgi:hypothetical protein
MAGGTRNGISVAYVLTHCSTVYGGCGNILVATYTIETKGWGGLRAQLVSGPPEHYFEVQQFDAPICAISPTFCAIYNEAKHAEHCGLLRICGAGYRKALEFLIKDYLIRHKFVGNRALAKEIATAPLATCIDKYIDDKGIQDAAHRAAWLGNDETHYVRKWTDKDLEDLKDLIAITVSWIALHVRLRGHLKSMPTKKPPV